MRFIAGSLFSFQKGHIPNTFPLYQTSRFLVESLFGLSVGIIQEATLSWFIQIRLTR